MKASCLCVTQGRPAFMDWLMWNYDRQSYADRELVIVDSSAEAFVPAAREDVRVIHLPAPASQAEKRNRAMDAARGEVITWFDDDDWQHPDKVAILVHALSGDALFAGATAGWFVNLRNLTCARFDGAAIVLLPTFGGRRQLRHIRFTPGIYAADTGWLWSVRRAHGARGVRLHREDLSFWLCHDRNLYNRPERWHFDSELGTLRDVVGDAAWGDTDEALEALRARLGLDEVEDP
jgi:glycosyltransferase involved in cell wall biosynthesis